jgi:SAM-dependent methyltransferase
MKPEKIIVQDGLRPLYRTGSLVELEVPPVQPILDALIIQRDDVIAEIGAGAGHYTLPIARHLHALGGSGIIYACDFSKTAVEGIDKDAVARGVAAHVRTVSLSAVGPRCLPFADDQVQSVLVVNTLQYLADPAPCLADIARILAPCGSLLIADWRRDEHHFHGKPGGAGIAPEALYSLLDRVGLDVHVRLNMEGYSWAVRAMNLLSYLDSLKSHR